MKKLQALLILILCQFSMAENVSIVTYNLKPFHFNLNGKVSGREAQVQGALSNFVKQWFDEANVSYQLELRSPKDRAIKSVQRENNGAIFLTPIDADLQTQYDFIGPVTTLAWGIFQTVNTGKRALDQVSEQQLLVEARSEENDALKRQDIRGKALSNQRDIVNAMLEDSANLWAIEAIEAQRINKAFPELGLKPGFIFETQDLYLAIDKQVPQEKKAALQAALDRLMAAGVVAQLLVNYINN